jgi:hypothetical protein
VDKEDRRKDRERDKESGREKERERENPRSEFVTAYAGGREWEEAAATKNVERERSASVYREESREKRDVYEDRIHDERAEKVPTLPLVLVDQADVFNFLSVGKI